MAKSKTHNKERHYKEIIAKQRKIIRELQKQVGRAGKIEHRYQDLEEKEIELALQEEVQEKIIQVGAKKCTKCEGNMDLTLDVGKVKMYNCENCGNRTTIRSK